ncbi:MAG: enoyl-CoA hydratase/isomerase family protein, partial [Gammaproteobacteria bacterium]|nr:enoyl-CoA hydratase/isomerase family protein [Gammaproteobacteria bacterium]
MAAATAFQLSIDDSGIATIAIDVPGEAQNTLKEAFVSEISQLLDQLEANADVKGLIITSGKDDSFVAGADITMLKAVTTAEQAQSLAKAGQDIFNRLERLKIPSVAAVNGACLGGGLELAMACHQRVASSSSKTKLGLPEV